MRKQGMSEARIQKFFRYEDLENENEMKLSYDPKDPRKYPNRHLQAEIAEYNRKKLNKEVRAFNKNP